MNSKAHYKICIIDDSEKSRESLRTLIGMYCENVKIVGEGNSVKSGLNVIKKESPDLILLDIEMGDGTGFDLLRQTLPNPPKVIFISAHEEYALKALKLSAVDFVLKPVDPLELIRAINKATELIQRESLLIRFNTLLENIKGENKPEKKIVLKTSEALHVVSLQDIIRCQADDNYTTFYVNNDKKIIVSRTLKEFEGLLSEYGFLRCHQSHLVNRDYIVSFKKADGGFLIMKDKSQVPVSSRNKDIVLKAISEF